MSVNLFHVLLVMGLRLPLALSEAPMVWTRFTRVQNILNQPLVGNEEEADIDHDGLAILQERAIEVFFTNVDQAVSLSTLELAYDMAEAWYGWLHLHFGIGVISEILAPARLAVRGSFAPAA